MRQDLRDVVRRAVPDSLLRVARHRRVAHQLSRYAPRTVKHTYWRWPLTVELADPMAEGWYDQDLLEPRELQALEERGWLVPNALVFDLGAHQGVVALMMSRAVGPGGKVVAIEAGRHNARIAERNRNLNDAANLQIVYAAGAAEPGVLNFDDSFNGRVNGSAFGTAQVRAVSVDELAAEHGHPAIVFVDVEGFENQVLMGASATLAKAASAFLIEVHPRDLRVGTLSEILTHFSHGWLLEQASMSDEHNGFVPFEGRDLGRFYLLATPAE